MFSNVNIVQSAISAFNNAALSAPAFFWSALLSCPIFILTYKYAHSLISKFNWTAQKTIENTCICTIGMTLAWVVLFGGNYDVLRDNQTLLPWVIAFILFMSCVFVGWKTKNIKIPQWIKLSLKHRVTTICAILLVLFLLFISDTHTWWGPILQIGSFIAGLIIGRKTHKNVPFIPACNLIMITNIIAILMQPEFFRFGQLGNLSPIHLIIVTLFGVFLSATVATRTIKPVGQIRQSAYIKLKWMSRVLTTLCFALFLITESVPMFAATCLCAYLMFALSLKHASCLPENTEKMFFGLTVCAFGILTTMPVITCMGLLTISTIPHQTKILDQSKHLL